MSIEPSTMSSKTIFTLTIIPSIISKYYTYCSMKICNLLLELSNSLIFLYSRLGRFCNWNVDLVSNQMVICGETYNKIINRYFIMQMANREIHVNECNLIKTLDIKSNLY